MNNDHSRVVIVVMLTITLAGCTGIVSDDPNNDDLSEQIEADAPADGKLQLHHINVGQADSTLIITQEGETILIDTGDWQDSGEPVLEYLDKYEIDRIDHLVSTHPHADHIGGSDVIINEFESNREGVGFVYDSGVAHTTQTYERYLDAIEEHDVELLTVEQGDELPLETEGLNGLVLNPPTESENTADFHYNSVTIIFQYDNFRYLTTGDAERNAEQRIVDEWGHQLDADLYHAGHHGSNTSSTQPLLEHVDPQAAIISSDFDSQFGHPHDEVLDRFTENDIQTYWTGTKGNIIFTTDGEEITVDTEHAASTDPDDIRNAKSNTDNDSGEVYNTTHNPPTPAHGGTVAISDGGTP